MFMTSKKCTCDLVICRLMNIVLIMDSNIENRKRVATVAYSAAPESFPLVDIAFVDVEKI